MAAPITAGPGGTPPDRTILAVEFEAKKLKDAQNDIKAATAELQKYGAGLKELFKAGDVWARNRHTQNEEALKDLKVLGVAAKKLGTDMLIDFSKKSIAMVQQQQDAFEQFRRMTMMSGQEVQKTLIEVSAAGAAAGESIEDAAGAAVALRKAGLTQTGKDLAKVVEASGKMGRVLGVDAATSATYYAKKMQLLNMSEDQVNASMQGMVHTIQALGVTGEEAMAVFDKFGPNMLAVMRANRGETAKFEEGVLSLEGEFKKLGISAEFTLNAINKALAPAPDQLKDLALIAGLTGASIEQVMNEAAKAPEKFSLRTAKMADQVARMSHGNIIAAQAMAQAWGVPQDMMQKALSARAEHTTLSKQMEKVAKDAEEAKKATADSDKAFIKSQETWSSGMDQFKRGITTLYKNSLQRYVIGPIMNLLGSILGAIGRGASFLGKLSGVRGLVGIFSSAFVILGQLASVAKSIVRVGSYIFKAGKMLVMSGEKFTSFGLKLMEWGQKIEGVGKWLFKPVEKIFGKSLWKWAGEGLLRIFTKVLPDFIVKLIPTLVESAMGALASTVAEVIGAFLLGWEIGSLIQKYIIEPFGVFEKAIDWASSHFTNALIKLGDFINKITHWGVDQKTGEVSWFRKGGYVNPVNWFLGKPEPPRKAGGGVIVGEAGKEAITPIGELLRTARNSAAITGEVIAGKATKVGLQQLDVQTQMAADIHKLVENSSSTTTSGASKLVSWVGHAASAVGGAVSAAAGAVGNAVSSGNKILENMAGSPGGGAPQDFSFSVGETGKLDLKSFKDKIAQVESGGVYDKRNKDTDALGKYQFVHKTLADLTGWQREKTPNGQLRLPESVASQFLTTPKLQEDVMDKFTMENLNQLKKSESGRVTEQLLAAAHFLGPKGALDWMHAGANPNFNPTEGTAIHNASVGRYIKGFSNAVIAERGGFADRPTPAIFGDAGPELIMPVRSMINAMVRAVAISKSPDVITSANAAGNNLPAIASKQLAVQEQIRDILKNRLQGPGASSNSVSSTPGAQSLAKASAMSTGFAVNSPFSSR